MYHVNLMKKWTAAREHLAGFWQTEEPLDDFGQLSGTLFRQFGEPVFRITNLIQQEIRTPPGTIIR